MAFTGTERFLVLSLLGKGGMGEVYQVFDRRRKTRVAVKKLRHVAPSSVARLKHEFRALQELRHPNLVSLYELFEDDGHWFFTMEQVGGDSFLHHVRGTGTSGSPTVSETAVTLPSPDEPEADQAFDGPRAYRPTRFDENRLRSALRQLTLGLTFLHESGQVHRDIKPGNVLVSQGGRLVLLDFGLVTTAKGPDDELPEDQFVGTTSYMAPEQAAGEPIGSAADWYSAGVMLYEVLVGDRPFSGSPVQVLMEKQQRDGPNPGEHVPGLPADLVQLCVDLLRRDPAQRPTDEEVARRLEASTAAQEINLGPPTVVGFVGRERELRLLDDALSEVREGRAATVTCIGEAGVGKTALVDRFLQKLDAAQLSICRGRCYPHESVPFKGIDGVMDGLCAITPAAPEGTLEPVEAVQLGHVFPTVRTLVRRNGVSSAPPAMDPLHRRHEAVAALRRWVCRLGRQQPLLIVIEDLHWAGADTWAVLEQLLAPPDPPPVLTLITTRDAAAIPKRLSGQLRPIPLSPLEPDETVQLATSLVSGHEGPKDLKTLTAIVADRAKGNPMRVVDAVQLALALGAEEAASPDTLLPRDGERLAQLEEDARRLLELVAVAGAPLPIGVLERAAKMEPGQLERQLAALQLACLARPSLEHPADHIEPYHDLIREDVIHRIPARRQEKLHRQLARALSRAGGADPELLAVHWRGANRMRRAARYALQAAQEADRTLAFDRAARLYGSAVSCMRDDDPALEDVLIRMGHAHGNAGRGAEAAAAFLRAAESADTPQAFELRRHAAEQLLCSGRVDQGLELLEQALRSVGVRMPQARAGALAATAFRWTRLGLKRYSSKRLRRKRSPSPGKLARIDACWSATVGLSMVDLVRGVYFQALHTTFALRSGDPHRIVRALALEAPFHAARGRRGERRTTRLLAMVDELTERIDSPHAQGFAAATTGLAAMQQGKFKTAEEKLREAVEIFHTSCLGSSWELTTAQLTLLWAQVFVGELREVSHRAPVLHYEARQRGNLYASTSATVGLPNLAWLANDDVTGALEVATQGIEHWSREQIHLQHVFYNLAMANLDLYAGNHRAAYRRLSEFWPQLARSRVLFNQLIRVVMLDLRGRAALSVVGTPDARHGLLTRINAYAGRMERQRRSWASGLAALLRAGIAHKTGRDDDTQHHLRRAVDRFEQSGMTLHATAARRRLGRLVGADEGEKLLGLASEYMTAQGVRAPDRMVAMLTPW